MVISIVDHEVQAYSHDFYDVNLNNDSILTLVTHTPSMVDSWISDIERIHRRRLHRLIVGLDIEWRPNFGPYRNRVATLQLCVGHRCLIFQLICAPAIPHSLLDFLGSDSYTFAGVGIQKDVEKLQMDYDLDVANAVDLAHLAAHELGSWNLRNAGLKGLAWEVLGIEIDKPIWVTLSRWDNQCLAYDQVQYACIDAFLSFEIGRHLNASNY
ncbi:hypothetical protein FNV43_RR16105 [Rhamnella rubrinervis]|uniref:3'-5' exonuclease domain-containing protein n=1 Tax=Rhamnella rubrinervis TaxID=2594499 RepID=A0A8K0EA28_9ROSA|nr:hypothetical protein FNV43_RR16105 [Rhamnella rubrinervis]